MPSLPDEPVAIAKGLAAATRAIEVLRAHAASDIAFRDGLRHLGSLLIRLADADRGAAAPRAQQSPEAAAAHATSAVSESIDMSVESGGVFEAATSTFTAAPNPAAPRPGRSAASVVPLQLGEVRGDVAEPGTGEEPIATHRRDPAAEQEARRDGKVAGGRVAHATAGRPGQMLPDLVVTATHSELKAEALRWAVRRRQLGAAGTDFADLRARDQELMAKVRASPGCWIWCLSPSRVVQADEALEQLAEIHWNLALAARLVAELESSRIDATGRRPEVWQLFAEAQSALRKANLDLRLDIDADQDDAFLWLRRRTEHDRVFVARHMRIGDPADPGAWATLRQRIEDARAQLRDLDEASRIRRRVLSKIRFIAGKLAEADEAEREGQWRSLDEALEKFVESGGSPSDGDLRELLLPARDTMPPSYEPGAALRRSLDAVDSWIEREETVEDGPRQRVVTPEVQRAAELLRGTVVLLIGGERRRSAEEALRSAFDLTELRWIATQEHRSIAPFEAEVARPEVSLVLLPIRWASHSFEGVQEFCQRHGKPFVRLPAGYHPNRVALEVLRQAERQLADAAGGRDAAS